jgi:hypothetical protein
LEKCEVVGVVKIGVKLSSQVEGLKEGEIYTVLGAEQIRTDVQGFNGVRVTCRSADGGEVAEMLWIRPIVGERTKLGAFVKVLGPDTDGWIGKKIKVLKWERRNRQIEKVR